MTSTIRPGAPSRLLVLLTLIALVSLLLLAAAVASGDARSLAAGGDDVAAAGATAPAVHRVRAGDTLWDIAASVTPPGGDVRATVHEVRRLNGLEASIIHPGDELALPAIR